MCPQHIRLYATRHLGALIRGSANANAWTLRLLLTQLYDPSPEVCELAVEFLDEACDSKEILQLVVEMQPTMDHLGEIGHRLLLKCVVRLGSMVDCSDIAGLCLHPWVSAFFTTQATLIAKWKLGSMLVFILVTVVPLLNFGKGRNIDYVVEVEVFLAKVFNFSNVVEDDEDLL
jgi:large subunit ribosomal protein L17e